MLKILALVVTVALGDSLNPSTIGPALLIASGKRARVAVLEFTLAVFVVHFAGGAILLLGPGHVLLSLVNKLAPTTRDALELAAGLRPAGGWNGHLAPAASARAEEAAKPRPGAQVEHPARDDHHRDRAADRRLTDVAAILTSTCPGAGVGMPTSSTRRADGGPYRS